MTSQLETHASAVSLWSAHLHGKEWCKAKVQCCLAFPLHLVHDHLIQQLQCTFDSTQCNLSVERFSYTLFIASAELSKDTMDALLGLYT